MDDKRNESLRFLCAALDACGEKAGVWYRFRCPICGGRAWVGKSPYNGHHAGVCDRCGMRFMQ